MSGDIQSGHKAATPAQIRKAVVIFEQQALDRITDVVLAHRPKSKRKKPPKRKKAKR